MWKVVEIFERCSDVPDDDHRYRRIAAQVLASMAKNLLMVDLGLAASFSAIAIPALTGRDPDKNGNELLRIDDSQISWLGSLPAMCTAIGCLFSGLLASSLGRKRAMYAVNVPHLIGWLLVYYAPTVTLFFVGIIVLGLGNGLMESSVLLYIGEIAEPSLRGALTASSSIAMNIGLFLALFLGSLMSCRMVALISASVPMIIFVILFFIPESPHWLLSRHRPAEALASLQWLRGWVSPAAVQPEFIALQRYHQQSNACAACTKQVIVCSHPPTPFVDQCRDLMRKRVLKPTLLLLFLSVCSQMAGMSSIRPYLVIMFQAYGVPMDANWATTLVGLCGFAGSTVLMCTVHSLGKRTLYLTSMTGSCVACFTLGIYGYMYLPADRHSLGNNTNLDFTGSHSYVPLLLVFFLSFVSCLGVWNIIWMLMSEIFPTKSRELIAGIASCGESLLIFMSTKVYLGLEDTFTMPGASILFGCICVVGLIVAYFIMPETEHRTLEEIELHFSDNSKSLFDINIRKIDEENIQK